MYLDDVSHTFLTFSQIFRLRFWLLMSRNLVCFVAGKLDGEWSAVNHVGDAIVLPAYSSPSETVPTFDALMRDTAIKSFVTHIIPRYSGTWNRYTKRFDFGCACTNAGLSLLITLSMRPFPLKIVCDGRIPFGLK